MEGGVWCSSSTSQGPTSPSEERHEKAQRKCQSSLAVQVVAMLLVGTTLERGKPQSVSGRKRGSASVELEGGSLSAPTSKCGGNLGARARQWVHTEIPQKKLFSESQSQEEEEEEEERRKRAGCAFPVRCQSSQERTLRIQYIFMTLLTRTHRIRSFTASGTPSASPRHLPPSTHTNRMSREEKKWPVADCKRGKGGSPRNGFRLPQDLLHTRVCSLFHSLCAQDEPAPHLRCARHLKRFHTVYSSAMDRHSRLLRKPVLTTLSSSAGVTYSSSILYR